MSFFISAHDPRIPTQLGPFSHLGPQLGLSSVEKKKYILFSIWAPHNEVWAPGASWAPAWALSTLKKIERHIHDFHDRNNKRIKFVDTRGLWVWEEEEEKE